MNLRTLSLSLSIGSLLALASLTRGAPSPPLGEQRTLVLLVNFQDRPTDQPWSRATVSDFFFSSGTSTLNGFWKENSLEVTSSM